MEVVLTSNFFEAATTPASLAKANIAAFSSGVYFLLYAGFFLGALVASGASGTSATSGASGGRTLVQGR